MKMIAAASAASLRVKPKQPPEPRTGYQSRCERPRGRHYKTRCHWPATGIRSDVGARLIAPGAGQPSPGEGDSGTALTPALPQGERELKPRDSMRRSGSDLHR